MTHTTGIRRALDRYGLKQSELTKIMPSAPPALIRDNAGNQPVSSEAAKNLAEREGDRRTDLRGAAGGYVLEGAKIAAAMYGVKLSGQADPRALAEFGKRLQPGDVVQFQTHGGDVAEQSMRKGLMHAAISTPIQKVTGSPQHHTAMFAGIDPQTGKLKIIHNYEQGDKTQITHGHLDDYAHQTSFHAYRPKGITPEMGAAAAGRAAELAAGPSSYAKNNLVAAGVRGVGQKIPFSMGKNVSAGIAASMATHCDPRTGICSALPVDAYTPVVGRQRAVEMMVGHGVPQHQEALAATPASISKSPHMDPLGQYHPTAQVGGIGRGLVRRGVNKAWSGISRVADALSRR